MRLTSLKLNGTEVDGVLLCGGPGFKVYSVSGIEGYVIRFGRRAAEVLSDADSIIAGRYVNLPYQPAVDKARIQTEFSQMLTRLRWGGK